MAGPDTFKQRYFTEIGPKYASLTGNTTRDLFWNLLESHSKDLGITSTSIIHDNACGPGTATEALISWFHQKVPEKKGDVDVDVDVDNDNDNDVKPPSFKIIATDYVPTMIETGERIKSSNEGDRPLWQNVEFRLLDSSDLSEFRDGKEKFTHSICNFSVFNFTRPEECLKEVHRTLREGGILVVTCWKRFAAGELLSSAQRSVMGDEWGEMENRVPVAGPKFFESGYLAGLVERAGFDGDKVKTVELKTIVEEEGENWKGSYEFLTTSSVSVSARKGWNDGQMSKWPEAVKAAMKKERDEFGGLLFEAWAVIAKK